ncbi:hypothetical protein EEL36_10280, partial [Muribaculaceae bacterium Isolate-043 (Harlan)]
MKVKLIYRIVKYKRIAKAFIIKTLNNMNVLAILKDFTFQCKSVFENTTTKMSKRFLNWLILTIRTVALIPGKVNFTRLSRY